MSIDEEVTGRVQVVASVTEVPSGAGLVESVEI